MGFDVTQLTQDEKQRLFTIKTNMPIPMLVYGDSFQWAKYGHHILPPSFDLTNHNKGSLHWTFWNSLIEFLRTDLDGNLSSALNFLTASRLDQYLSSLQEGLSETANKGFFFDQQMLHQKSKNSIHWWDNGHCIVCNTDSPIHIHKYIQTEVWKAFNVGINAWNITAVLHLNGDTIWWISPFCWKSFHIHVTV